MSEPASEWSVFSFVEKKCAVRYSFAHLNDMLHFHNMLHFLRAYLLHLHSSVALPPTHLHCGQRGACGRWQRASCKVQDFVAGAMFANFASIVSIVVSSLDNALLID